MGSLFDISTLGVELFIYLINTFSNLGLTVLYKDGASGREVVV